MPRPRFANARRHARGIFDQPRPVLLLILGTLIDRAGTFVIVFLSLYLSAKLGYSKFFAALCLGLYGFGTLLSSLAGGWCIDRFGRRPILVGSLAATAVLLLILETLRSALPVMLGVFAFGLVSELYRPASNAMIADLLPPERRARAFSLKYVALNLGFTLGAWAGGILAEEFGYEYLFWVDAFTTALFAGIARWALPETRPVVVPDETLRAETLRAEMGPDAAGRSGWSVILRDRVFLTFWVACFLNAVVFQLFFTNLTLALEGRGHSSGFIGELLALNGAMIVVLQLPATVWLERRNRVLVVTIGFGLLVFGFAPFGFVTSWGALAALIAVMTVGEILWSPFLLTIATELAPVELRGRYLGVFGALFSIALTVGAPLGGWVLEQHGEETLWAGAASLAALAALVFYVGLRGHLAPRAGEAEREPVEEFPGLEAEAGEVAQV